MNMEEFADKEGKEAVQRVIDACDFRAKYINFPFAVLHFVLFLYNYTNIFLAIFFSVCCALSLCLVWFNLSIKNRLIEGLEELDSQQKLRERLDKLKGK